MNLHPLSENQHIVETKTRQTVVAASDIFDNDVNADCSAAGAVPDREHLFARWKLDDVFAMTLADINP